MKWDKKFKLLAHSNVINIEGVTLKECAEWNYLSKI